MAQPLKDKVALVTGGSRGIGAAIAKRLAADGAGVCITYTNSADAAMAVVKSIELAGRKALAIKAHAADAEAVKSAVEKTAATFGRLDVLVNNAGTAIPAKVEETTLADFDRLFAINVRGTFVATKTALKFLKPGGRIIMIGSCLGERVMMSDMAPYSATKGAVKMFAQGLARTGGAWRDRQHGPAGPHRHRFEPRFRRLVRRAEGQCLARPLWARRRGCRPGRVRRRARGRIYHRREPHSRWRNERLTGIKSVKRDKFSELTNQRRDKSKVTSIKSPPRRLHSSSNPFPLRIRGRHFSILATRVLDCLAEEKYRM